MTDAQRIELARASAAAPGKSPAMTLLSVMAALGYDFGDADANEHQVMQYYADPDVNPFVQAQIEAKIVLDAGELERLAQAVKHKSCEDRWLATFRDTCDRLAHMADGMNRPGRNRDCDALAQVLAQAIQVGLTRFGANALNSSLSKAIDEIMETIRV